MPSAPRNFSGSVSGTRVTLRWDPPASGAPLHYYVLEMGLQPGVYDAAIPVGLLTTVSADLDEGVYYFRVHAVNAAGAGLSSPEIAVTVGIGNLPPGPPSNLQAGVVPGQLTLTWDPPDDGQPLTGYVVQVGRFPGTSDVLRYGLSAAVPTVTFPLGGVPSGTYFIRVAAVNAFGEGAPSNEVSLIIAGNGPPSAPRNFVATVANDLLTLTWDPPAVSPENVTYVLYADSHPGGSAIRIALGATLSHTRSTVGAAPGTFYLRVAAVNAFGEGPPSNEVSITLAPGVPPDPPQNPSLAISGDTLTLTWLPPPTGGPILNYIVQIGSFPGSRPIRRSAGTATSFSTSITGVAPGTYYFAVTAVNAFGESLPSVEASIAIGAGSPPGAPTNLQLALVNDVLMLTWDPPPTTSTPLIEQTLSVGTAPGTSDVLRRPLGPTSSSFSTSVAGATPGLYYLRVSGVNAFGEGPPSNEVSVAIGPYCEVPAAPVLTGSSTGGIVTLNWTTPAGGPVTGYTLLVAPGPGMPFVPFADLGLVNTISGPASPGTYFVRIVARAACGTGAASNAVQLTVP